MNITKGFTISLATLAVVVAAAAAACNSSTSPKEPDGIEELRASLAPYTSLTLAKNAGYSTALTDCMSNGDLGAMGVHFANTALLDGTTDPLKPEVLIYEPGTGTEMSLVGVEFIVPFAVLPKTSPAPVLFDQRFTPDDTFGVWALHVWTPRANPSGLFAPWNPRVSCK